MRSLKLAGIAVLVALGGYAASLAFFPPKTTVAAAPKSPELFSVQILRMAEESPAVSYDSN